MTNMTKTELLNLVTRYTEACDDLGAGLFEQTAEQTATKHKVAGDLWAQIGAEVERLHADGRCCRPCAPTVEGLRAAIDAAMSEPKPQDQAA